MPLQVSDDVLTKFKNGTTIVDDKHLNAMYGGLYGSAEGALYETDDPVNVGHIHDGQHKNGHAQKIDLVNHVTGKITGATLENDAVSANHVAGYTTQSLAIPEFEVDGLNTYYYLDLSDLRSEMITTNGGISTQNSLVRYSDTTGIVLDDTKTYIDNNGKITLGATTSPSSYIHIKDNIGDMDISFEGGTVTPYYIKKDFANQDLRIGGPGLTRIQSAGIDMFVASDDPEVSLMNHSLILQGDNATFSSTGLSYKMKYQNTVEFWVGLSPVFRLSSNLFDVGDSTSITWDNDVILSKVVDDFVVANSLGDVLLNTLQTKIYNKLSVGHTNDSVANVLDVRGSALYSSVTPTPSQFIAQIVNTEATDLTDHAILRLVSADPSTGSGDYYVAGYYNSDGSTLGTRAFKIAGNGTITASFTGQHYVVLKNENQQNVKDGMIVVSNGEIWNDSSISECIPEVCLSSTENEKSVYGVYKDIDNFDNNIGIWGNFNKSFNLRSAPNKSDLTNIAYFNGTEKVTMSSIDGLKIGDFIWLNGDFNWFKIKAINDLENEIEIDSFGKIIPIGSGTVSLLADSMDPAKKPYSATSPYYKAQVNSIGEGKILVTNINGDIYNGDYITTSNIAGYGQKQGDDMLRNYTVAKCVQNIDWVNIEETVEYKGVSYKVALVACTYHCG